MYKTQTQFWNVFYCKTNDIYFFRINFTIKCKIKIFKNIEGFKLLKNAF